MIIWLKYFHDSLNVEVILAPGCEFISAKCAHIYGIKVSDGHCFTVSVIVSFEINFVKKSFPKVIEIP